MLVYSYFCYYQEVSGVAAKTISGSTTDKTVLNLFVQRHLIENTTLAEKYINVSVTAVADNSVDQQTTSSKVTFDINFYLSNFKYDNATAAYEVCNKTFQSFIQGDEATSTLKSIASSKDTSDFDSATASKSATFSSLSTTVVDVPTVSPTFVPTGM